MVRYLSCFKYRKKVYTLKLLKKLHIYTFLPNYILIKSQLITCFLGLLYKIQILGILSQNTQRKAARIRASLITSLPNMLTHYGALGMDSHKLGFGVLVMGTSLTWVLMQRWRRAQNQGGSRLVEYKCEGGAGEGLLC